MVTTRIEALLKRLADLDASIEVIGKSLRIDLLMVPLVRLRLVMKQGRHAFWCPIDANDRHQIDRYAVRVSNRDAATVFLNQIVVILAAFFTLDRFVQLLKHPCRVGTRSDRDLENSINIVLVGLQA